MGLYGINGTPESAGLLGSHLVDRLLRPRMSLLGEVAGWMYLHAEQTMHYGTSGTPVQVGLLGSPWEAY